MFHAPRTANEMRLWYDYIDQVKDYRVRIKRRRCPRNLPNAYDDIFIFRTRNWKRKRKTQYKGNK